MFVSAGWTVRDLAESAIPEMPEEDTLEVFATFEENARAKARFFFAKSGGVPVVADDSGLEVAALSGAPGVMSKRWSNRPDLHGSALDETNNALLLERLRGVRDRRARYVCAVVYWDGVQEVLARGVCDGRIADDRARGAHGFGYDPYFFSDDLGRSFSDATREEKATVSHRGRAIVSLLKSLR